MKKTMIRFISCLLVAAMLASMPVIASAASVHTHDMKTTTVAATCTSEGYKIDECQTCGYTAKYDITHMAEHTLTLTKTEGDIQTYTCSVCKATVKIDKTHSHDASALETQLFNATCVRNGYSILSCNVCGYKKYVDGASATGHTWSSSWTTVKEPTTSAEGREERVCEVCGEIEYRPIAKLQPTLHVGMVNQEMTAVYTNIGDAEPAAYVVRGYRWDFADVYNSDKTWCQIDIGEGGTPDLKWIPTSKVVFDPSSSYVISAYQGAQERCYVNTIVDLKVHSGPVSTSAEVSSLDHGSVVYVYSYDSTGKWGNISKTEQKWIELADVIRTDVVGSGLAIPAPIGDVIAAGSVTKGDVNVYASASASSAKLGVLPKGTSVEIYEKVTVSTKDVWGRIHQNGFYEGWIDLSYVTLNGQTSSSGSGIATGTVSSTVPLNVRKEPKISATNRIGTLTSGTKVTILETKNTNGATWGRIDQDGLSGWVCMDYVVLDAGSTVAGDSTVGEANATVVNCSTAVNVRSEAKVTSKLVSTIRVGTRITVTKKEGQWAYVANKGWVFMDYIALDNGAEAEFDKTGNYVPAEKPIPTYTNVAVNAVVSAAEVTAYEKTVEDAAAKVVTLVQDTEITIQDRTIVNDKIWGKVTVGDLTGWILMDGNVTLPNVNGTVSATTVNVYKAADKDSQVVTVLGSGTKVSITDQYVDGTYVWGKLASGVGYVQLNNIRLDVKSVNDIGSSSVGANAIIGKTTAAIDMMDLPAGSTKILKLEKDTSVTVNDWKYASGKTWGKVTKGQFTGWIDLEKVEQNEVPGTVSAETVNLYASIGASKVEKVLRSGNKITVTKRLLVGSSAWAQTKINDVEYWFNLSGVTLAGSAITTTPSTTPATTPSTGTVINTATSVPGTVANAEVVNVRSAAGVSNDLVTTLKKGVAVNVYEQVTKDNAPWGRIDQGWICLYYVNLSSSGSTTSAVTGGTATGSTTIMTTVPSGALAVGFVNIDNVNIRSAASTGSNKVGTLKKGTNVVIYEQVLKEGMIWGRVDQGWICTSYVTMTAVGSTGTGTSGLIAGCFYTVNVRSTPGVQGAIVGKIMVNSRVEVYETKTYSGEQWGRTSLGWVAMQYVMTGTIPTI